MDLKDKPIGLHATPKTVQQVTVNTTQPLQRGFFTSKGEAMHQYTSNGSAVFRDNLIFARVAFGDVGIADDNARAERIAACLQACEGISTESLLANGATSHESVVALVSKLPTVPPFPAAAPASDCGYRPDAKDLEGLHQYPHELQSGLVLDCWLDYTPLETASYDHAGSAAQVQLMWAMVGGIDISEDALDDRLINAIEVAGMAHILDKAKAEREALEFDRGADLAERMAA